MSRRTSIRISPEPEEVCAHVFHEGRVEAQIIDVSEGGAQLSFAQGEDAPDLPLADDVKIAIDFGRLEESFEFTARAVHRRDNEDTRVFNMSFAPDEDQAERFRRALERTFNLRQTVRVSPDPAVPVRVQLRPETDGSLRVEASLVDISTGGVAVSFAPSFEKSLSSFARMTIRVYLPDGDEDPMEVPFSVIARDLVDDHVRYQGRFVDLPEAGADRICDYVMSRQRELLSARVAT